MKAGRDAIAAELSRIVASRGFRQSRRRCELLRWSVERYLNGETAPVKEYEIGLAVFGKPESWDCRIDPIVRVEFNRMRRKLGEFYEGEGRADPVVIEFPARGYIPVFTQRVAELAAAPDPVAEAPASLDKTRSFAPRGRWAIGFVLAAAMGVVAIAVWAFRPTAPRVSHSSIAVLPFADLSAGHQDEYLSEGFTRELTNALGMVDGLETIADTSAFQFKGTHTGVREIGRALGAGWIVEGGIRRAGNRIHVNAELERANDGTRLWQAQYDRDANNILAVQDEIRQSIAEALRVPARATRVAEFYPGPESLDEYLKGVYEAMESTPASLRTAIDHFENAVRLSPRYALAYAGLGRAYISLASVHGPAQQADFQQARHYLEYALSLDPRLAQAHAELAYVQYVLDWNWPSAEVEFRRALALASTSNSHRFYAFALTTRGRFAEAEMHYRKALELDPLNRLVRYNFAILLQNEGRWDGAREQLQFCLGRDPNWFLARLESGYVALYDHRPSESLDQLRYATALAPNSSMIQPAMAAAYAEAGQRGKALALMRRMESQASEAGYVRYHLAVANAFLGDTDGVFYWLERSVEAHEQQALFIRINPVFAPYQHDPRMLDLERRTGLIP